MKEIFSNINFTFNSISFFVLKYYVFISKKENHRYWHKTQRITSLLLLLITMVYGCEKEKEASPRPRVEYPEEIKAVKLDDPNIHIMGAAYVSRTPNKLSFKRFSEETLNTPATIRRFDSNVALSTTGISIQFKTKSPYIQFAFSPEPGLNEKGSFKILRDGQDFKTIPFEGSVDQPIHITFDSLDTENEYVYEIILPSYTNLSLTKLEVKGDLVAYEPEPKGTYISFGDSITHGRGQDGCSFLTYPFLLAQKLDMNLYNLAIGGSRISIPVAQMADDLPEADLITILIGFNDFESANQTKAQFEANYRTYLTEIRNNQPTAEIYCITLLYTTRTSNTATGLTPDHFRNIVKNIVEEYQVDDSKLHLIEGDDIIISSADLIDRVHLNIAGADKLANGLYDKIN